ncbi:hypothetical protein SAMN04490189_2515 [Pseudomonas koreensis]|jgi:hypothetical protein|nr:hypothetical protein SAMN04490189_2515 [Pseudomonas koreensis]
MFCVSDTAKIAAFGSSYMIDVPLLELPKAAIF